MNSYVALLRGINVGGRNSLPMKVLVSILEEMDAQNVQTYIQSGNIVFQSSKTGIQRIAEDLGNAIESTRGFRPGIQIWSREDFLHVKKGNPYPQTEEDRKSVHLFYLESEPVNPDFEKLEKLCAETEKFELKGKALYLFAPEGIGKSKFAARVEAALGVSATARNWRTVTKLADMISEQR
ncbi:MAG: hypothetical protein CMO55_08170 [Verrucomicrobiales bacterium]|nr:hypothetical protein [Verrucomicrobiales bacterium]